MADSVVRLRVDSAEHDNKLKKASGQLGKFIDNVRKMGTNMASADAEAVNFVRAMGQMDTQAKNTNGQVREMTKAVTDLTIQYRSLTDEEKRSPFGQAMAQSIQQLTERAGAARDAMADVSAAIAHTASDTRTFDQLSAGAAFVTSSFQTLQGAAKLVGIEMGDNVEVLAKLQAAMAVTNGLTTIQNALQKQSALMQGLVAVQARARAAAEALATKGTIAATAAQKAFNLVAEANPYVLLATAVAGVATAMIAFAGSTDEATEAEKRQQAQTEQLRQMHENFAQGMRDSIGKAVGEVTAKFVTLQDQWVRLKTVGEQEAWIKNNQSAFNALGLSVKDVNGAYRVFIEQADDVVAALQAIAEAKALQSFKEKQLEEYYNIKYSVGEYKDNLKYTPVKSGQVMDLREIQSGGLSMKYGQDITWTSSGVGTRYQLTAAGAEKMNQSRIKAAQNNYLGQLGAQQSIIDKIDRDAKAAQDRAAALSKNLPFLNGGLNAYTSGNFNVGRGGGGRGGGGNTTTNSETPVPVGSLKAYEQELSKLREAQQLVTNNNDWQYYAGQIDVVTKKMKEIRGETEKVAKVEMATGDAGATGNAMGSWISGLQEKLSNTVVGSEQSYKLNEQLLDTQLLQNTLNYALANDITISPDSVESIWEQIIGEENVPDSVWEVLQDTINDILAEKGLDPITLNTKTGGVDNQPQEEKKEQKVLGDYLGGMASGISSIAGGLEDFGVKVPDGIYKMVKYLQATQAILTGISTVVGIIMAIQSAKAIPILGIAMASGGVVHAAGGIVAGRHFSGDNIPAMLDSGEVVLNRAQAGVIANRLQNGGIGNLNLSAEVSAEKLRFVLNNNGRRTGRGEIAYSRRLVFRP